MLIPKKLQPTWLLFEDGKKVVQCFSEQTAREVAAKLSASGRHITCDLYDLRFSPSPPAYCAADFVQRVFEV